MAREATLDDFTKTTTTTETETPAHPEAQSIPDFMADWDKKNPEPVKREVQTPELTNNYGKKLDDILDYYKPKEPTEAEQKRDRANRTIAAIGDGLSAVVNLIGTAHGAKNVYDHKNGMSAHYDNERAQKLAIEGERRKKYNEMLKTAADRELTENQKKLTLYKADMEAANREQRDALNARATARRDALNGYAKWLDQKRKDKHEETVLEHNHATEEQARENLEHKKADDAAKNGIARQRNAIANAHYKRADAAAMIRANKTGSGKSGSGSGKPAMVLSSKIGTLKFDKVVPDAELRAIVTEMEQAGAFGKLHPSTKVKLGMAKAADVIQQGMATNKGYNVVLKHWRARNK